jgi:hypothetical protein
MKRIFCQILGCWMVVMFVAASGGVLAQPRVIRVADASFCLDSMETVPIGDDLVPTPIAVDGGCMMPQGDIIAI